MLLHTYIECLNVLRALAACFRSRYIIYDHVDILHLHFVLCTPVGMLANHNMHPLCPCPRDRHPRCAVGKKGNLRRITNWPQMTKKEQEVTLRRIGKRNRVCIPPCVFGNALRATLCSSLLYQESAERVEWLCMLQVV